MKTNMKNNDWDMLVCILTLQLNTKHLCCGHVELEDLCHTHTLHDLIHCAYHPRITLISYSLHLRSSFTVINMKPEACI